MVCTVDVCLFCVVVWVFFFSPKTAFEMRISDWSSDVCSSDLLGTFQGVRPNQLTGYGIVVGLAGTGDDSLDYATQGMKGVVSRYGLTLPQGINPALKNAAAVLVTADPPAFALPGPRLAAPAHSTQQHTTLLGAILDMRPLHGEEGEQQ